jgi:hypothetical protein
LKRREAERIVNEKFQLQEYLKASLEAKEKNQSSK